MVDRYKVAFLIPSSAKKTLCDEGWIFKTEDRLRPDVLDVLKRVFNLEVKEEYLGVVMYIADGIKVSVIYDEAKLIEQIYIQLLTRTPDELTKALCEKAFDDIEIFFP